MSNNDEPVAAPANESGSGERDQRPGDGERGVRSQLITLIGATVILLFVFVWGSVLISVWTYTPGDEGGVAPVGAAMVVAAGTLSTTVGTLTAGALGFTIADVKKDPDRQVTVVTIGKQLNAPTAWAVFAYLIVGVAVLITWLFREDVAPELVVTFGFSILGWLVGGAGAAFRDPSPQK